MPRVIDGKEEVWFKNKWGQDDRMHVLASCRLRFSGYIQAHVFALRAMPALAERGVVAPDPNPFDVSLGPNYDNEAVACDSGEADF